MKNRAKSLGVVIGRFQTHTLHTGHTDFLDFVSNSCERMLIVLGCNDASPDSRNPLDFESRMKMIRGRYPDAIVDKIYDTPCDHAWSSELDQIVATHSKDAKAILFGSRNSFLDSYKGIHETSFFKPKTVATATDMRKTVKAHDSKDFREGIIYSVNNNFPTSFQTVDIIIENEDKTKVILGRKNNSTGWCFPGGFVDPNDSCLEFAARREAREEVGDIELDDIKYLVSCRINDYRYQYSEHKIMTAAFVAKYIFGAIKAGDDLDEVKWVPVSEILFILNENHKEIAEKYLLTKKTN